MLKSISYFEGLYLFNEYLHWDVLLILFHLQKGGKTSLENIGIFTEIADYSLTLISIYQVLQQLKKQICGASSLFYKQMMIK